MRARMASWEDEALAPHLFPAPAASAFVPYPCGPPYPAATTKDGWRLPGGGCRPAPSPSPLPGVGQLTAAEYLESYRRAQLLAWLWRLQPGWTPRAPRAPGRCHAAVQVNPRCDAAVQCSLGRRRLQQQQQRGTGDPDPDPAAGRTPSSPPPRPVRFPRTVSMYSPMVFRRLTALLDAERSSDTARSLEPEDREETSGNVSPKPRSPEDDDQGGGESPAHRSRDQGDPGLATQQSAPARSREPSPEDRGQVAAAEEASLPSTTERDKERMSFQFLEQKYGYYHCKDCHLRWESAYVWCVQGTNKVYFKQFCRTCQKSYNPYRVEDITCQSCKRNICSCPVRVRHVDPKRPHRQDLCGRCKGKRLSCDSTFSFKYLI
uniref:zygote arrest protein 1 n=1 Tax=Jaculus jaculus TaxID=51337 RepID=UPI001E1B0F28|nr:zygote arrest protein 1 [Jaculus jaculus]